VKWLVNCTCGCKSVLGNRRRTRPACRLPLICFSSSDSKRLHTIFPPPSPQNQFRRRHQNGATHKRNPNMQRLLRQEPKPPTALGRKHVRIPPRSLLRALGGAQVGPRIRAWADSAGAVGGWVEACGFGEDV